MKSAVIFIDKVASDLSSYLQNSQQREERQFHELQKNWKVIAKLRFQCSLLSILIGSVNLYTQKPYQCVNYLLDALKFYKISEKQTTTFESKNIPLKPNDDWYSVLQQNLESVITLLNKVITNETAKYFKIAGLEFFNFLLLTFQGNLSDSLVEMLGTVFHFLLNSCRYKVHTSRNTKQYTAKEALNQGKNMINDNNKNNTIVEEGVFEIENHSEPYASTTPILYSNVASFLENILTLLPVLSANILHQIFEKLIISDCSSNLELPLIIRLKLINVAKKIIIICQADLNFGPQHLSRLIEI